MGMLRALPGRGSGIHHRGARSSRGLLGLVALAEVHRDASSCSRESAARNVRGRYDRALSGGARVASNPPDARQEPLGRQGVRYRDRALHLRGRSARFVDLGCGRYAVHCAGGPGSPRAARSLATINRMPLPESARAFLARKFERLRHAPRRSRIVFPEGDDPRVRAAAARLIEEHLIEPILIGTVSNPPAGARLINAATCPDIDKYAVHFLKRRGSTGVTEKGAVEAARRPLYFAALMVAAGHAPAGLGGAGYTTS